MSNLTDSKKEREFIISSKPENITQVENYIETVLGNENIISNAYGNILIGVIEAANNAIIHGNSLDSNKFVSIKYNISDDKKNITFIVSDEGIGFNYNSLPDPTAPENIEKLGGRGVFLMKQLADLVVFEKNGSIIELTFSL